MGVTLGVEDVQVTCEFQKKPQPPLKAIVTPPSPAAFMNVMLCNIYLTLSMPFGYPAQQFLSEQCQGWGVMNAPKAGSDKEEELPLGTWEQGTKEYLEDAGDSESGAVGQEEEERPGTSERLEE